MKGKAKHIARLKKLSGPEVARVANAVVSAGADTIRAHAHHLISRGSASESRHVPSKPGDPPNRDIGNLQAHLEATNPKPLIGQVASKARYAGALEFGTSKMAARPYMRPARDAKVKEIRKDFADAIDKLVKRSG